MHWDEFNLFVVHVVRYSGTCIAVHTSLSLGSVNYVANWVSGCIVYMRINGNPCSNEQLYDFWQVGIIFVAEYSSLVSEYVF